MDKLSPPNVENDYYQAHLMLLTDSFQRLLGRPLIEVENRSKLGQTLFEADFALLSHDIDDDPRFNYANRTALNLFALTWPEMVGMPSRYSAEPLARNAREALLDEVSRNGYITDYSGVRIAKTGQRFVIENAIVWNIYDQQGCYYGQAACFKDWRMLDNNQIENRLCIDTAGCSVLE